MNFRASGDCEAPDLLPILSLAKERQAKLIDRRIIVAAQYEQQLGALDRLRAQIVEERCEGLLAVRAR
jgi:hypothetical protein